MRIMAIDYGDAHTGIAISDPTGFLAGFTTTIHAYRPEVVADQVVALAVEHGAQELVLGYPKNMDGTIGFKAEEVRQFIADLTAQRSIEVIWVDERLTTVSAERTLLEADVSRAKRKKVIDKMAAVLILQSYLDRL